MLLDFSTTRHVFNPFLLTSALIPEPRAAFCQWFEDFGRRLAPADLGNVPLYVVDAALAGPGDTLGFAGESLDLAYQEQIGQRWRGRGACFAVDLQQVQDQADIETPNEEARKAGFIRQALALALHEFAHVLSQAKLFSQGVTQSAARQSATRCLQTPDEDTPGGDVAWVGHDGQFLRTVAHVEHRARALLRSPVQAYAVAGLLYGLSKGEAYRQALADEPAKLAGKPLAEIMQTRPPQSFIDLWQADLRAWRERHEPLTKSQALAMEQGQTLFSEMR